VTELRRRSSSRSTVAMNVRRQPAADLLRLVELDPARNPEWVGDAVAAVKFGSPESIRAALLPEQVAEFDAAYDAALTAARQTSAWTD
jgi:hypothetical protein